MSICAPEVFSGSCGKCRSNTRCNGSVTRCNTNKNLVRVVSDVFLVVYSSTKGVYCILRFGKEGMFLKNCSSVTRDRTFVINNNNVNFVVLGVSCGCVTTGSWFFCNRLPEDLSVVQLNELVIVPILLRSYRCDCRKTCGRCCDCRSYCAD